MRERSYTAAYAMANSAISQQFKLNNMETLSKTQFLLRLTKHLAQSEKPVIFLIGDITNFDADENGPKFLDAKQKLEAQGFHVINPCDFINLNQHWLKVRQACIKLMLNAEHVAFLPNWNFCKEARLIQELSAQLGINAIYQ